jgi:hypothetical protein
MYITTCAEYHSSSTLPCYHAHVKWIDINDSNVVSNAIEI